MNNMKQMIKAATLARVEASARQRVLETIIADFFRVYLGTEAGTVEDIRAALGEISTKLLAMQADTLKEAERTENALMDIQRAVMNAQAEAAKQAQEAENAPPEIAAVD